MLLIQQSPTFRAWTSRALIVYFRRVLIFLVVSPRENNHGRFQQQTVYFSDAADDEEVLIAEEKKMLEVASFDRNQNNYNRLQMSQSKRNLLKEYVFNTLSQGLNNSMAKSIQKETINSSLIQSSSYTKQFDPPTYSSHQSSNSFSIKTIHDNENKLPDNFVYQTNCSCLSTQQPFASDHNEIYTLPPYDPHLECTSAMPPYSTCSPLNSICKSSDTETSSSASNSSPQYSSTSIQQNPSQLSDDKDDIYEKYQTSFSHILHQTKSLHTIRKEDKLESMLALEPNTSIITVRQITYHPFHHSMITSHICVRLIANRADLSTQCDITPIIGCKKPLASLSNNITESISISNEQQTITSTDQQQSSNKRFEASSILIDIPYKILYIDS